MEESVHVPARPEPDTDGVIHWVTLEGRVGRSTWRSVHTDCGQVLIVCIVTKDQPVNCAGCLAAGGKPAVDVAERILADAVRTTRRAVPA